MGLLIRIFTDGGELPQRITSFFISLAEGRSKWGTWARRGGSDRGEEG